MRDEGRRDISRGYYYTPPSLCCYIRQPGSGEPTERRVPVILDVNNKQKPFEAKDEEKRFRREMNTPPFKQCLSECGGGGKADGLVFPSGTQLWTELAGSCLCPMCVCVCVCVIQVE